MTCFNTPQLLITLFAVILIIGGGLMSEHSLDVGNKTWSNPGLISFISGWIIFIIAISLEPNTQADRDRVSTVNFSGDRFLKLGLSAALVAASAIGYHMALSMRISSGIALILFGVAGFLSWIFLAYMISKEVEGSAGYVYTGVIMILIGLSSLMQSRRYDPTEMRLSGPGHVYNPGLPLLTFGWILVALSVSKENRDIKYRA
jgi:hypothetical protein